MRLVMCMRYLHERAHVRTVAEGPIAPAGRVSYTCTNLQRKPQTRRIRMPVELHIAVMVPLWLYPSDSALS